MRKSEMKPQITIEMCVSRSIDVIEATNSRNPQMMFSTYHRDEDSLIGHFLSCNLLDKTTKKFT